MVEDLEFREICKMAEYFEKREKSHLKILELVAQRHMNEKSQSNTL
jgi:hypothetical protein